MTGSALYRGRIRHRRLAEVEHAFEHSIWHVLLDLDEIPALARSIRFFAHNRFNVVAFDDRDHLGPGPEPVRDKLAKWFHRAGLEAPDGRIQLLTGLRHLGWGFNPVSFYFCHHGDLLRWVLAEVNNTFGETCCYLLRAAPDRQVIGDEVEKIFHVSPFQPVAGRYRFRVTRPAEHLSIHIDLERNGRRVFDATLTEERRPLDSKELLRAVLRHPHQTVRILALIHLQAARLWLKRAPFFTKPEPPPAAWRTHG